MLGGEQYPLVRPVLVPARLDISRTTGDGYALRLRFQATLVGPCMRCLEPAAPTFEVDAREVSQPGEGDDLSSPYVQRRVLDLRAWAREALALVLPTALLCRRTAPGCAPSAAPTSTRPAPTTVTSARPIPAGRSCRSSASTSVWDVMHAGADFAPDDAGSAPDRPRLSW